jgi:phage gp36-like protein
MSYASLSDLTTFGLPATAIGPNFNTSQQQAFLDSASGEMDQFLGGRYSLPLVTWPNTFAQYCSVIAAYHLLVTRGYNPAAGADPNFENRYKWALEQLRLIQNQQLHPVVTPTAASVAAVSQPFVFSSSVVDVATGCTAPNRGW